MARIIATVCAVAIVALAAQSLVHELIGHGGGCLWIGSQPTFFDSIYLRCARESGFVDACGPAANLLFGALSLFAFRKTDNFTPGSSFLWLVATMNLLMVTGYMFQSALNGRGDWASLIAGLHPALAWRLSMGLLGLALYYGMLRLLCRAMIQAVNRGLLQKADLWPLMLLAYLITGVVAVASGALNPDGVALLLRNAAAESFLGMIGLLIVPGAVHRNARESARTARFPSSTGWIVAGASNAGLFVFVLGPGIYL